MKILPIEALVTCGSMVTINDKRYRVTAIGVRGCGKYHANSPVEYYALSGKKELFSVTKQKRYRKEHAQ